MGLTKNELAVMEILWSTDRPLSRAEILSSASRRWQPTAVSALINALLKKEMIAAMGFFKSGKTVGRTYEAIVSKEEYLVAQMYQGKPDLVKIVTAFLDHAQYDKDTIQALEDVVQKRKAQWGMAD